MYLIFPELFHAGLSCSFVVVGPAAAYNSFFPSSFLDSSVPIDYNLYSKFWLLQDYFRNPTQCYTAKGWRTFSQVLLQPF